MQCLEVSGAVRPIEQSLSVKESDTGKSIENRTIRTASLSVTVFKTTYVKYNLRFRRGVGNYLLQPSDMVGTS